jgi:hypothetical protein
MAPRKNGPVITANVPPEDSGKPDIIAAAIAAAKAAGAAKRQQRATKAAPAARVRLTAQQAAAMTVLGWKAPTVDASNEWKPAPRQRQNACQADDAYNAALSVLEDHGVIAVGDLAQVWQAFSLKPRPVAAVAQQLANRAQRTCRQKGGELTLI